MDLNKAINEHCQHLTVTEQEQLLILVKKYKKNFGISLGTWDMISVEFEIKEGAKPLCLRMYPVPKSQEMML